MALKLPKMRSYGIKMRFKKSKIIKQNMYLSNVYVEMLI